MQAYRDARFDVESISLTKLKDAARRLLPPSSPARNVILAEKDILPMNEALAKFEVFDRLLSRELGS
jgi:hypothetical protein